MLRVIKIISSLLLRPEHIRLGVTFSGGITHYALVIKEKNSSKILLSYGSDIPWWLHLLFPDCIHTELSGIPVHLFQERLVNEDPDTWIDNNEEKVIPAGFTSDMVVYEFYSSEQEIFSATITKKDRDAFLTEACNKSHPLSLRIPLHDLIKLYQGTLPLQYVLWKITNAGSVLVYVSDNQVQQIVNLWIDCNDLISDPSSCTDVLSDYMKSMSAKIQSETPLKVFTFSPVENYTFPELRSKQDIQISPLPEIKGVPFTCVEAYAIACNNEALFNFLPFDTVQKSKQIVSSWVSTIVWLKRGMIGTIAAVLFLIGCSALIAGLSSMHKNDLAFAQAQISEINRTRTVRDSLAREFKANGRFAGNESNVTLLLSDLQLLFPEGMWAEEIGISENKDSPYLVNIRAIANSSGLLGTFMNNARTFEGLSNVRMVYSEQIVLNKNVKALRCKIEFSWKR